MFERVLEPEVMDTMEEASAYDSMDHSKVNQLFVSDLLSAAKLILDEHRKKQSASEWVEVLDLGTGTALQPIELCNACDAVRVLAVDAAEEMLLIARNNIELESLTHRIMLDLCDAKNLSFSDARFPITMSNSIVHHIPEPIDVLKEMVRVTAADGLIFVRDLMRPKDEETLQHLVQTYAGEATEYQRKLFGDSLRAALTLEEIQSLVSSLGFDANTVQATTDRHWTWTCRDIV